MESLLVWGVIIIVGIVILIGAIAASAVGLSAFSMFWWLLIPIIGAYVGGLLGFLFGLGLVIIIGFIVAAKNSNK